MKLKSSVTHSAVMRTSLFCGWRCSSLLRGTRKSELHKLVFHYQSFFLQSMTWASSGKVREVTQRIWCFSDDGPWPTKRSEQAVDRIISRHELPLRPVLNINLRSDLLVALRSSYHVSGLCLSGRHWKMLPRPGPKAFAGQGWECSEKKRTALAMMMSIV